MNSVKEYKAWGDSFTSPLSSFIELCSFYLFPVVS